MDKLVKLMVHGLVLIEAKKLFQAAPMVAHEARHHEIYSGNAVLCAALYHFAKNGLQMDRPPTSRGDDPSVNPIF